VDKVALFAAFRGQLEALLADLGKQQEAARSGTRVDGDHRPENRGERAAVTSQGYLTLALGQRIAELREHRDQLDRIDPGARGRITPGALFLAADEEGQETWYLVLPGGQGARLVHADTEVLVVSPESPVARSLSGLGAGDEGTLRRSNRVVEIEVLEVR
jgi:transcription elongation GreA/GreB family factor